MSLLIGTMVIKMQQTTKHIMGHIDFERQVRECTACRRILHFSFFTVHTDTGKPFSQCKECKNKKNLEWRIKQGNKI